MIHRAKPLLVAISGGSGSGKTRLAQKLQALLGTQAARLSLDDFYRDRSHLSPAQRARINFDHPRAIEWPAVERALRQYRAGKTVAIPDYDFTMHCRWRRKKLLHSRPVLIVEGLWLLRQRSLRRLFDLTVFINCSARERWRRRLARDLNSRGRTLASVRRQWRESVEPMHIRFVMPQRKSADIMLRGDFGPREVKRIVARLRSMLSRSPGPPAT